MSEQLPPAALQRRHWYAKVGVTVLVQLPEEAVSVAPACAVPEIDGTAVLAGTTMFWTHAPSALLHSCWR